MTIEYPKIETLYDRDKNFKVDPALVRCPEFEAVKTWHVTEKVDGMNVRVVIDLNHALGSVKFCGRTDNADMPPKLIAHLDEVFPLAKLVTVFQPGNEIVLFGEGYGGKIQSGGRYRPDPSFRLFDVLIGKWWMDIRSLEDIAGKLGVQTVPTLGTIDWLPVSADDLDRILMNSGNNSIVAENEGGVGCRAEGIVARSSPLMLTRSGHRIMWKLKYKDFQDGAK